MELTRDSPPLPLRRITFEEFHDGLDGDDWMEWVDGEVVSVSPVEEGHELVARWLVRILSEFIDLKQLGRLLMAPFLMRLAFRPSGREPDLMFVSRENLSRLKKTYLDGPADLVVEIVSPESRARDREEKLREYEQAGVREYWVIDLPYREALFYQLGEDGRYHLADIGEDHRFHSRVLEGLWLNVDWLWTRPLPPLMTVLREWKLI